VAKGISLVWRTDTHLSDFAPESRTDDWPTTLLGKLAQVGEVAKRVKALGVLDGGDLFHIKTPSRNSHSLVGKVAAIHTAYPCPTWSNIGNHDVKYGSFEFLDESPLGVLFESGSLRRLYDEHEAIFEQDGIKVRVVGIPYHGTEYDMGRFAQIQKNSEDFLVASIHCLASLAGGTMYEKEDVIKYADLVGFAPDLFLFGHWHRNQGIDEIADGKWVVNVGSLSRGSLNQDEVNRVPTCVVLNFSKEGIKIIPVPLKVAPADEVFNMVAREVNREKDMTMEAFVDSLKTTLVSRGGGSVIETVRCMSDVEDVVRERAIHYLERAL